MLRKAVLIGSPFTEKTKDYLYGVKNDINNMQNYLLSSLGGNWRSSEIHRTNWNPSRKEVIDLITEESEYTFIYFAGHGYINSDDNLTYICLNERQDLSEEELLDNSPRQTIIIDACREISISPKPRILPLRKSAMDEMRKPNTRRIFNEAVNQCPEGLINLFSTGRNQFAKEIDLSTGRVGLFTDTLIKVAKEWQRTDTNSNIFDIYDAYGITADYVSTKTKGRQNPQIDGGRRRLWHPFAAKFTLLED